MGLQLNPPTKLEWPGAKTRYAPTPSHPRLDGRKTGRKLPLLTARQMQIAECVSEGMSNKQIAFQLGLSEGTVRVYLAKTFDRVNVKNRLGLAFLFREQFAGAPKPQNEPSHVADGDIRMGAFE